MTIRELKAGLAGLPPDAHVSVYVECLFPRDREMAAVPVADYFEIAEAAAEEEYLGNGERRRCLTLLLGGAVC